MKSHTKIIIGQAILLLVVVILVYILYPRIDAIVTGDLIRFNPINAKVILISDEPEFSNPRYIEINDEEISFNLKPGKYYWKASNGIIKGFTNEFVIDSEVSMKVDIEENNAHLVNVGNVKINVSKTKGGQMIGHIILEPEQEDMIENAGDYTGRQQDD